MGAMNGDDNLFNNYRKLCCHIALSYVPIDNGEWDCRRSGSPADIGSNGDKEHGVCKEERHFESDRNDNADNESNGNEEIGKEQTDSMNRTDLDNEEEFEVIEEANYN